MGKFWNIFCILSILSCICFICLKLFNIIEWSWWLVFLPLFLYPGIVLVVIILVCIAVLILPASYYEEGHIKNDEE